MSTIIRIKRSSVSGNPNTLAAGELAYSALQDNGANGGDRLYIGIGTETDGNAANHIVIGGKAFTDKLDHTPGTLTASSAIIVDSNSKIDNLKVDNLELNDNTLSTTNSNGNLILDPNGTGLVSIANAYTLPRTDGTAGQALVTNGTGTVSFTTVSTSLSIADNVTPAPGTDTVSLLTDTLTFAGTAPINTAVTNNTVTISASDATTSTKGVASFSSASFDVTAGVVSIKSGGISTSQLDNSNVTIGTTTIALGASSTTLAGLQEVTVDQLKIDANSITAIDAGQTDINIVLTPKGDGTVDVSNKRITSVLDPTQAQDAATKAYVDSVAEGLAVKPAVRVATTANLTATYSNGTNGVGATLTIPATATLTIDGVDTWSLFDGILVKDQTNEFENGRYYVSTIGDAGTDWVLTRCPKCDQNFEIPSMYVFVQEGTVYENTGWVAVVDSPSTFVVGTSDITFTQFSGAGTYLAGSGLSLSGTTFNVNTAGGIEISSDNVQLASSVAGDGLAFNAGVINVAGTAGRISVSENAIDIDTSYIGQSTITTLGTVTTGTWNATAIGAVYGGTGQTSYATGDILYASATNTLAKLAASTEGKVLQVNASGVPVWGDVDGGTY